MSNQDNITNWITYVYDEWLFATDKKSSLLESSQIIVNKMKDAILDDDAEKVWYLIERLKKISNLQRRGNENNRKVERAETLLECGIAAYKVGDLTGAILLLNESAGGYTSDAHFRATVIWIRSCIQWMLPARIEDAISGWELSRSLFKGLQTRRSLYAEWYEERVEEMRRAIDRATAGDGPLPYTATQNSGTYRASASRPRTRRSNERHDILRMYPVFGQIPAGQPLTLDIREGWLDIDEAILGEEQKRYRIVILSGERIIRLLSINGYYLLQVIGNSMNIATPEPLNNGDFVLMREQNTADSEDIVAVEITGFLDGATLKRYREESGNVLLYPESNDFDEQTPIDPEEEARKVGGVFSIRGIAIAVFKEINETQ